jgi:hypothetical protein
MEASLMNNQQEIKLAKVPKNRNKRKKKLNTVQV